MLCRLPLGPTPLPMLYTLKPPASQCSRCLIKPSALAVSCWGATLTQVTPSCFRNLMLSSDAAPALVPILIPGGIGRSVPDAQLADESRAAPPRAIFARSLRAGCNVPATGFDSGVLI